MKGIIRNKVSGNRRRFKDDRYDLDLSYITETIIAMSFPASKVVERMYRNDINTVSKFLDEKHGKGKYFVYNMSNREELDTAKFHDNVVAYPWEDHHSPSLKVLFNACEHMY